MGKVRRSAATDFDSFNVFTHNIVYQIRSPVILLVEEFAFSPATHQLDVD
jgi:hypothetical protein